MRLSTKKMREGKYDNKIVWICDYNQPDFHKKPLRKVVPVECIIISNDQLPNKKTINYSESHFVVLKKNKEPSKKVISPVDNTGYRWYPGNELYIYDNETECITKWNELINEHVKKLDQYFQNYIEGLKLDIINLKALKIENNQ